MRDRSSGELGIGFECVWNCGLLCGPRQNPVQELQAPAFDRAPLTRCFTGRGLTGRTCAPLAVLKVARSNGEIADIFMGEFGVPGTSFEIASD
jgi:hypothetical protein